MKYTFTIVCLAFLPASAGSFAPHKQLIPTTSTTQSRQGLQTCGIFVATAGDDHPACGLQPDDPCQTIEFAIDRADLLSLACVFIQTGYYQGRVVLKNGIHLVGGFNLNWQPGTFDEPGHEVLIDGAGSSLAIRAHNLTEPASISDLILLGPETAGKTINTGMSSYVVNVVNTELTLNRVKLIGGIGDDGRNGGHGIDASQVNATPEMHGGSGQPAGENDVVCDTATRGIAGQAGMNPLGKPHIVNAGDGGDGGKIDTTCDCSEFLPCPCGDCTATSGDRGLNSGSSGADYGIGGNGGTGGTQCDPGEDGLAGRVTNGMPGIGATQGGSIIGVEWVTNSGTAGTVGEEGTGGGGGGGSGGCDIEIQSYGAGGGGGGAGGIPAVAAGDEGIGGGGSFGILAISSTVHVHDCVFELGTGGNGGDGGHGGRGQDGGLGGAGGAGAGTAGSAGKGGDGAHGGHAGGGGGGAGGVVYGIYECNSSVFVSNTTYSGGTAGLGGAGGIAAPGQPDSPDGGDGADGVVVMVDSCPGALRSRASNHKLLQRQGVTCDATPCAPLCPADITPPEGNGEINVDDLLVLIGAWGQSGVPSDLNNDGTVNVDDLLILIAAWGPCP